MSPSHLVYNSTVPNTITNACGEALLSDVACDPVVKNLRPHFFYTPETLTRVCTDACRESLLGYQSSVQDVCGEEVLPGSFDLNVSVLYIPGVYQYLFESTCMEDGGRYCNNVAAAAAAFADPGSDLCIANACTVVTVSANDTCKSISRAANITEAQLHAWNPIINYGCYNIESMEGTQLCVSAPGMEFVPPPTTDLAPITPTTAAPVPTDAASGSNNYCARWYDVQPGDYCNLLTLKFGISLEDFVFLNPSINANCTNLLADESYCVQAVGDIDTYSGRPGYSTATPTAPFTGIPFTALPDATETPYARLYPLAPLANDTRDDCSAYFVGDDYQYNLSGTRWAGNCAFAAQDYNVTVEDLGIWNPSLANSSAPDCAFTLGLRYCGSWYDQPKNYPTPTTPEPEDPGSTTAPAVPPGPTHPGQPADCDEWHVVVEGDSCQSVADAAGISREQFLAWNPAVSEDCLTNFWLDQAYCVGTAGDGTTTTTSTSQPITTTTATVPTPGAPTHTGQPANCDDWHIVVTGDTCTNVAEEAGISLAQFLAWNPAVSADCVDNFWLEQAYCIGVSGDDAPATTTATTTSAPAASPTNTTPPAEWMQEGMAANCNKWSRAVAGDYCFAFAERNQITLSQLVEWNTALGTNGDNCGTAFWLDYYYCVGVSA
ncbi:LysM domain-containing protein [Neofusicoccum parvum]|uniref:LysM domain-containing protein n=1 Tax=Neofusicoccum parvum TaxID=310453 RepID=A0ACB5SD68_9PEZI|nr:LysM domain-containing protein [Neofusicoccum parvum]